MDCSLEDFALGCTKDVSFTKQRKTLDLRAIYEVEATKQIFIKPGYGKQTELRFAGEGHEYFNHSSSDLVVRFSELPHPRFERRGDDLLYLHSISLSDALTC